MFRTRFNEAIVAEFLPPDRPGKTEKAIIVCDGMPSIPRKQPLVEFLSRKGYWVFYPRYRGAWESSGQFLERPPQEDILEVIRALSKPFTEIAFGQQFKCVVKDFFVIGGSFGGATTILSTLDSQVKKAVANCPVVDWSILASSEKAETSNPNYAAYIREAFGNAYRLSDRNWKKLGSGTFFNPAYHIREIDASKLLMFHAKDDPYVPYHSVQKFAEGTGVRLKSFRRGGHLGTEYVVQRHWPLIRKFFES
jgi:pimeloyl-ACP methyl ester carboxylesterase